MWETVREMGPVPDINPIAELVPVVHKRVVVGLPI